MHFLSQLFTIFIMSWTGKFFLFSSRMQSNQFYTIINQHLTKSIKLFISIIIITKAKFYTITKLILMRSIVICNYFTYFPYHFFGFFYRLYHPGNSTAKTVDIRCRTAHIQINTNSRKFNQNFCSLHHMFTVFSCKLPHNLLRNRSWINIKLFKLTAGNQSSSINHFCKIFMASTKFFQ